MVSHFQFEPVIYGASTENEDLLTTFKHYKYKEENCTIIFFNDNVFALYKLLASDAQIAEMRANYLGGNYGYGHAKQALYELIIDKFTTVRERYNHYMENKNEIDAALASYFTGEPESCNQV